MGLLLDIKEINRKQWPICGGKAKNLAILSQNGLPVPASFVITTRAFDEFLRENDLTSKLEELFQGDMIKAADPDMLENLSLKAANQITKGSLSPSLLAGIERRFANFRSGYGAVRSSASEEDSAQASWAGQLSSFLNVRKALLPEKIRLCWASLFNVRALSYGRRLGVFYPKVSIAVIVQQMIDADAAGIIFTVDPVSQDEGVMVIEAGLGLGEPIAAGQVTPDTYYIDKATMQLVDFKIGKQKRMMIRKGEFSSVIEVPEEMRIKQKLSSGRCVELSKMALEIESIFSCPQDIEFAVQNKQIYILQARPISTLFDGQGKSFK